MMYKLLLWASSSSVGGGFKALEGDSGGWQSPWWWEEDNIDSSEWDSNKEDDNSNDVVDNYNNIDDDDKDANKKNDDNGEDVAVNYDDDLTMVIWWQQLDNNAGMTMAASIKQEASKPTPPLQGNNQLMLTIMGEGDKREGQYGGEGTTEHHVAHAEIGRLGLEGATRVHKRMVDGEWQDNLPYHHCKRQPPSPWHSPQCCKITSELQPLHASA